MTRAWQRPSRRWGLGLLAAAVACLLAVTAPAGPAAAHATLVASDPVDGTVLPRSPESASFTFDEPVTLPPEGVQVFDAAGDVVPARASAGGTVLEVDLPDRLTDGTYVVVWGVVSADGHPVSGSLTFSVGAPSPRVSEPEPAPEAGAAVTAALGITQGAAYMGLLLTAGLSIFSLLLPPSRADRARRRLRRTAVGTAALGTAAAFVSLPLASLTLGGGRLSALTSRNTWAGIGSPDLLPAVMTGLGLGLVASSLRVQVRRSRLSSLVLVLGLALAVIAPALGGHARAAEPQLASMALDALHVLVGAVWLGGLVGLALTLPVMAGRGTGAEETLARFSGLAAGVLAVLVASGGLLAWRIIASWEVLTGSRYGWLLMSKVALVGLAVAIAAGNRYVLLPRARADGGHRDRRSAIVRLRRVITLEASVIVLVVAVTGFLVNQAPRPDLVTIPDNRTGVRTAQLGDDVRVLATLTPGRVGRNDLLVQLQDRAGEPVETRRLPVISLRTESVELGRVVTTSADAGTFRGTVVLPEGGTWRLQVSQRVDRFTNPVGVVAFDVRAGDGS